MRLLWIAAVCVLVGITTGTNRLKATKFKTLVNSDVGEELLSLLHMESLWTNLHLAPSWPNRRALRRKRYVKMDRPVHPSLVSQIRYHMKHISVMYLLCCSAMVCSAHQLILGFGLYLKVIEVAFFASDIAIDTFIYYLAHSVAVIQPYLSQLLVSLMISSYSVMTKVALLLHTQPAFTPEIFSSRILEEFCSLFYKTFLSDISTLYTFLSAVQPVNIHTAQRFSVSFFSGSPSPWQLGASTSTIYETSVNVNQLLLLLSGDVEVNPGPYSKGDLVFAKLGTFRYWPAEISEGIDSDNKYTVFFFGSHNSAKVKEPLIKPYLTSVDTYGKSVCCTDRVSLNFNCGLSEIRDKFEQQQTGTHTDKSTQSSKSNVDSEMHTGIGSLSSSSAPGRSSSDSKVGAHTGDKNQTCSNGSNRSTSVSVVGMHTGDKSQDSSCGSDYSSSDSLVDTHTGDKPQSSSDSSDHSSSESQVGTHTGDKHRSSSDSSDHSSSESQVGTHTGDKPRSSSDSSDHSSSESQVGTHTGDKPRSSSDSSDHSSSESQVGTHTGDVDSETHTGDIDSETHTGIGSQSSSSGSDNSNSDSKVDMHTDDKNQSCSNGSNRSTSVSVVGLHTCDKSQSSSGVSDHSSSDLQSSCSDSQCCSGSFSSSSVIETHNGPGFSNQLQILRDCLSDEITDLEELKSHGFSDQNSGRCLDKIVTALNKIFLIVDTLKVHSEQQTILLDGKFKSSQSNLDGLIAQNTDLKQTVESLSQRNIELQSAVDSLLAKKLEGSVNCAAGNPELSAGSVLSVQPASNGFVGARRASLNSPISGRVDQYLRRCSQSNLHTGEKPNTTVHTDHLSSISRHGCQSSDSQAASNTHTGERPHSNLLAGDRLASNCNASKRPTSTQDVEQSSSNNNNKCTKGRKYILGDSIIKGLGQYMSDNVCAFTCPGITTKCMEQVVKNFSGCPSDIQTLMFHVGSNDFHLPIEQIISSMRSLLCTAFTKFPKSNIIVSGPLHRCDVHIKKVHEVNQLLFQLCRDMNVPFVDANYVIKNGLSKGGIHLNNRAKCVLADVLTDYIGLVEANKLTGVSKVLNPNPSSYFAYPTILPKNF
jgi:hypothetical protein